MSSILFELMASDANFQEHVDYTTVSVPNKTVIINENERLTSVYLLKSGRVRVTTQGDTSQGINTSLGDINPGELFGEFSLFDTTPTSATVTTMLDSELIKINIDSLKHFMESNPAQGYKIMNEIVSTVITRLKHVNKAAVRLLTWGVRLAN